MAALREARGIWNGAGRGDQDWKDYGPPGCRADDTEVQQGIMIKWLCMVCKPFYYLEEE